MTKSTNFCEKNPEIIDNVFFIRIEEEKIKNVAEKSFSVFVGLTCETFKHTSTFFGKIFNNFFKVPMKNTYYIISRFVSQHFVDLVKICFFLFCFTCNTFLIKCNEGLFIDVNQKLVF